MVTCRYATMTYAPEIAAISAGRLNFGVEPTFEALVWRAVINRDPSFCVAGGLLDDHLVDCEAAARLGHRSASDHGVTVTIDAADH